MKASLPFGFLGGAARPVEEPPDDGRVVELFRSRAELRKQQEELNETLQRMRDRLKQQEAATQRVQEMLGALERRLESADSGLSTLVFYHLRSLWHDGREIIGQVVKELSSKHEEREKKAFALEGNRRQFAQRQSVEQQLRQAESSFVGARQSLSAFDARLGRLDRWWHRRQRNTLAAQRPALVADFERAERALQAAREKVAHLDKTGAGDFPGLSVDSKRAINVAAIACAEVLCLRLAKTDLVARARAAMSRREVGVHYGDLATCVGMMGEVVKARHLLKQRGGLTQEMGPRGDRLRTTAAYLGEYETVPVPESCGIAEGDVLAHGSFGATASRLPNVLAEDTWELSRVLLR
jgi:hypothetical protein